MFVITMSISMSRIVFLLLSLSLSLFSFPFALCRSSSLSDILYSDIQSDLFCTKLLSKFGTIGCSSSVDGDNGILRIISSPSDWMTMEKQNPSYPLAVVIPLSSLVPSVIQLILSSQLTIGGLIVLHPETESNSVNNNIILTPPPSLSTEIHSPQYVSPIPSPFFSSSSSPSPLSYYSPQYHYVDNTLFTNNSYDWNPIGNSLQRVNFPFSVIFLSNVTESNDILSLAESNEQMVQSDTNAFPYHAVHMYYFMYAEQSSSSIECLNDGLCIPVGGYSTWGSLTPLNGTVGVSTDSLPIVLAISSLDSSAFFHGNAVGADSDQSGVISLLGAASALSSLPIDIISSLTKRIIFSFFTGESFGRVGSRKFVDDLVNFSCEDVNLDPTTNLPVSCNIPYKYSLEFTKLNFSNIENIFELQQVGHNASLFTHKETSELSKYMENILLETTKNLTESSSPSSPFSLNVSPSSLSSNGSLPPSSSMSFLSANSSIGVVVLTDHDTQFTNPFYHEILDDINNINGGGEGAANSQLCQVATLSARTIFQLAGGTMEDSMSIHADCNLISLLTHCLLVDSTCPLIEYFIPPSQLPPPNQISHYSSVFNFATPDLIGGMDAFNLIILQNILNNQTQNIVNQISSATPSSSSSPLSSPSLIPSFFHDAFDPSLQFDFSSSYGDWIYPFDRSDTEIWTESNWDSSVGTKIFRAENPQTEIIFMSAAFAVAVITGGGIGWGNKIIRWAAKR